jgi:EpsI family protein
MSSSRRFLLTLLMLGATLGASMLAAIRVPEVLSQPLETISTDLAGWRVSASDQLTPGVLRALIPTSYIARTYTKGPGWLQLFIAYYSQQRSGEAMHSPKACLPGAGWEIWKYDSSQLLVNSSPVKVNKYFIQRPGERMIVYYWYQSPGRIVASEYLGKLLLVRDALRTGRTGGSIVRVTVPDEPASEAEGMRFAAAVIPEMRRCLGQ